jgi:phosphate transport system permease protein
VSEKTDQNNVQVRTDGQAQAEPSVPFLRGPSPFSGDSARSDRNFEVLAAGVAGLVPLTAIGMLFVLGAASWLCFSRNGLNFISTQNWDPVKEIFGGAAFSYGTLMSSLIALLIAGPLGIAIALAITEFAPLRVRGTVALMVELLAAVPSVIYGLWGMFVLAPFMRAHVEPVLVNLFGPPFFRSVGTGLSLLTAGVVVAIMILPTVMAICREVFDSVPISLREASLALGATRWESTLISVIAPSGAGIIGALILGMGRALGETMAVTMVIGNRAEISANLLAPSDSLASAIANQFTEATGDMHLSALAALGFLLFFITMALNLLARGLVWFGARRLRAAL